MTGYTFTPDQISLIEEKIKSQGRMITILQDKNKSLETKLKYRPNSSSVYNEVSKEDIEEYAKRLYDSGQLSMTLPQYEQFINHLCEMFSIKE